MKVLKSLLLLFSALCGFASQGYTQNTFPATGPAGIGTTNPQSLLDARGSVRSWELVINNTAGSFDNALRSLDGSNHYDLIGTYHGWDQSAIYIGGFNSTTVAASGWPSSSQRLIVGNPIFNSNFFEFDFTTGAAGIGTQHVSDPNYRLFVEKGIRTRMITVDQSSWPDFVFSPGYQLLPLDSVSRYINVNHHLPDMPSADSVNRRGLDLGSNQAALLKKIEELTLYMIKLDKDNQELRKEIESMHTGSH